MKLKIRDGQATINGDKTEHEMPSGVVDIIADDGRTLFSIQPEYDGIILSSCGHCRHQGKVLESGILVRPAASNVIRVYRQESDLTKQPLQ